MLCNLEPALPVGLWLISLAVACMRLVCAALVLDGTGVSEGSEVCILGTACWVTLGTSSWDGMDTTTLGLDKVWVCNMLPAPSELHHSVDVAHSLTLGLQVSLCWILQPPQNSAALLVLLTYYHYFTSMAATDFADLFNTFDFQLLFYRCCSFSAIISIIVLLLGFVDLFKHGERQIRSMTGWLSICMWGI